MAYRLVCAALLKLDIPKDGQVPALNGRLQPLLQSSLSESCSLEGLADAVKYFDPHDLEIGGTLTTSH